MLVRKLTEDDLEAVWTLRLRALADNPEAFGSTYEATVARGKVWMLQRFGQGDATLFLGAFEETLIGAEAAGKLAVACKRSHTAPSWRVHHAVNLQQKARSHASRYLQLQRGIWRAP
jgi:hypothetical protein